MGRFKSENQQALRLSNLHVAVIRGATHEVLSILKSKAGRKTINSRDVYGSTPLMMAVLTGRLKIAKLLLRTGASTKARDYRGRSALKYGRASLFKRKLATYRQFGLRAVSKSQEIRRARITKILRHPAACASRTGDRLILLKPENTFKLDKQQLVRATTGVIASLIDPKVKMAAASGWTSNTGRGVKNVLDNSKYTQLVHEVCEFLDFDLTPSMRDNNRKPLPEHAGRFHACHVEKKLTVYWIIAALNVVLGTTDFRHMHKLQDATVPDFLKQALIILDHWPCRNLTSNWATQCWQFLGLIKRVTGIGIYVEPRPFLVGGTRQGVAGCQACECERCVKRFRAAEGSHSNNQNDKVADKGEDLDMEDEDSGDDINVVIDGDDDGEVQPYRPREQAPQARVLPTSSPEDWITYPSALDQAPVAKPRCLIFRGSDPHSELKP
ncbi:Serine/threonine-protein phosphatase 6 regulatory ankyrin repeat subunit C [Madurella mycetomatis]|uniref:Serine/threonine-protein phosphatase 6 regulatory ankyrin repeat subunit C n=1 Tax=Madurella mycetomatis TaxID=100816 RepID=A0A175VUE9_9PEZI|nr:Serine/threonine-protein phosphatase 6 regulatory ankyrin repeat subunit C [Madurella mycetomatis]